MSLVTLKEESVIQHGFYVPQFEVKIEGVGLPRDVLRDVLQLTYHDNIKEIDNFEITVNNWDPGSNRFKYIGSETPAALTEGSAGLRYRLFEPSEREVEVSMGYAGDLRIMLRGTFTAMEPNFPSGGGPTLVVRGLNVLHKLRGKPYTYSWEHITDSKIAKSLEGLNGEKGTPRFAYSIQIDPTAAGKEPELEYVAQENMSDIEFLMLRARQRGYVIFVQEEDKKVKGSKKSIYFGPSHGGPMPGLRDTTFRLKWGQSLLDFKPSLTTASQFKTVTVNGWNRKTKKPIQGIAKLEEYKNKMAPDVYQMLLATARDEITVNEPVFTRNEAKERAKAIFMDRHKEMIKASGTVVGLPDLRAGRLVHIEGVGSRLSGIYFVTDTTHTINDSGYITKFNARREDPEQGVRK
jgi:phage protein D